MTGPPNEKRRPGGGGAHDRLDADLTRQYTYTAELATLRLVYSRPAWRDQVEALPRARKPKWTSDGRVVCVHMKPVGYRLVETSEGWRIAWWHPTRRRANRCQPFTAAGTYEEVLNALSWLRRCKARPVYPALPAGGSE